MTNETQVYKLTGDGKASTIELGMLKKSQLIRVPTNIKQATRPVQSWEFIEDVKAMLDERAIDYQLTDIFVQKSESQQVLTSEERSYFTVDNTPIDKWLFNQLITKILIRPNPQAEMNTALAISFNKNGILTAFGKNVTICQNMCVFGNNLMSTYGKDKVPYDKILEVLNRWMDTLEAKSQEDLRIIEALKSIKISGHGELQRIVGNLYMKAVRQAYNNVPAPFTVSQMSSFVREIDSKMMAGNDLGTAWDLYNVGTNLYKPNDIDMVQIFQLPKFWFDVLTEEYSELRNIFIEDAKVIEEVETADDFT